MSPRAAPMSADDRRKAIVAVLLDLVVERGGEVSTREIAEAAGIAEGTIFRVFSDKRSLMMAVAEEAMNPADGQASFDQALAGLSDLREKVVAVTSRVLDRMHLTMSVMMAVRPHLMAAIHEDGHTGHAGHHDHAAHPQKFGPPDFVLRAQAELHHRLTSLFEPHADELRVEPEVAALALRSLIFGASRPELGMNSILTPDQIADVVLNGVAKETH